MLDDPAVASLTLPTGETVRPAAGFSVIATSNAKADDDLEPALRDRFPVAIRIDRPHPGALKALPADVSHAAQNSAGVDDPQRRVSVRAWAAFARLREGFGDEALAARLSSARGPATSSRPWPSPGRSRQRGRDPRPIRKWDPRVELS